MVALASQHHSDAGGCMSNATEATRKAIYLSHFTPSMMPAEALESMLVQREPLLKTAVESIIQSVTTGSRHHQLFVGPRGIGKTHLISLIHHRVSQDKEVTGKALIAWMREEEWGVTSFFELVMRILRNLNLAYPALEIDKQTQPLYDLKLKDAEVKASEILATLIKEKVLIILMENLDDLFEQLGDAGQKQWRAFIQNHPQFVLVTTTPSLFSGVSAQKSVFYGFFDITQLDEFSFEEVSELLRKIAAYREDAELVNYLATAEGRARVRAVHHLAEGNPRIYIIFSQFLSKVALDELVQAFMHTLDELTPYYQARMKELSGQQRKILEFLINYKGAASVKEIAKACFITQQTCSSQLKSLKDSRFVRDQAVGRFTYYELREPLMRLCMSVKSQHGEPIDLFVEMLKIWYSVDQLKDQLIHLDKKSNIAKTYLEKAIDSLSGQQDPKVSTIYRQLIKTIATGDFVKMWAMTEELIAIDFSFQKKSSKAASAIVTSIVLRNESIPQIKDSGIKNRINEQLFYYLKKIPSTKNNRDRLTNLFLTSIAIIRLYEAGADEDFKLSKALLETLSKIPSEGAIVWALLVSSEYLDDPTIFDWVQKIDMQSNPANAVAINYFEKIWRFGDAYRSGKTSARLQVPHELRKFMFQMTSGFQDEH
jgi:DNA-binding transcriptional ArsR family regulator